MRGGSRLVILANVMLFSVGLANDNPVIRTTGSKPIGAQELNRHSSCAM
jgi:hypothetical protein